MAFGRYCNNCKKFFNAAFFTVNGTRVSLQYCPCCHDCSIGAANFNTLRHLPISEDDLCRKFFSGEMIPDAIYDGKLGIFL